jgi:hypothetical protein
MPRLLPRQEPPYEPAPTGGRTPACIACGNRRTFWVRKGDENMILNAWEIERGMRIVACGRCRSRHSVVFESVDF